MGLPLQTKKQSKQWTERGESALKKARSVFWINYLQKGKKEEGSAVALPTGIEAIKYRLENCIELKEDY